MDTCFSDALKAIWQMVFRANEFVDRQAPWKLAKDPANAEELDRTLGSLARELVRQCVHLAPFMPNKCEELWRCSRGSGKRARCPLRLVDFAGSIRMAREESRSAFPERAEAKAVGQMFDILLYEGYHIEPRSRDANPPRRKRSE